MGDDGAKKGFAGLDSLVSDASKGVGKKEDTTASAKQASKVTKKRHPSSTGASSKHNVSGSRFPGTGPIISSSSDSQKKKLPDGVVLIGMLGLIAFLYFAITSLSPSDDDDSQINNPNHQTSGSSDTNVANDDRGKTVTGSSNRFAIFVGSTDPLDKMGVCELQELLGELGHYNSTVDGLSGPGTRRAISALLSDYPDSESFQPTTRVLEYARSKVSQKKSGFASTTSKVTLPQSGQILSRRSNGEAPFKITTSPGENFYVKLVDIPGGNPAITFFVRGGDTTEMDVPLGTYSLRYASGNTWYGTTCLFGRNTTYFEADTTLAFYRSGTQVVGHRVELIRQIHGNMDANKISAGRF